MEKVKLIVLRHASVRTALRIVLVTLGWGTTLASIALVGIFSGLLLPRGLGGLLPEVLGGSVWGPRILYLAMFGTSVLAALVIENAGAAFGCFFVSYGLAGVITYLVLVLPGLVGAYPNAGVLAALSITFTFTALFPFPLLVSLLGTVVGLGLAERVQ